MNRIHHWMMTACLVIMGVAMFFLMWRGQSLGTGAWLLLSCLLWTMHIPMALLSTM